jgi:L-ascorbate metabolism protein UlaG (beta-lactamase superfamily)
MKLTYLGHSCFALEAGGVTLLTDPFLTGNPLAAKSADAVRADYILVTHAHGDHLGDAVAIARRCGATVVTTVELAEQIFGPQGVTAAAGNLGGTLAFPFGTVKFLPAAHSCGLPGGIACGFLITLGGKKVYFAGDTALLSEMAFLREEHVDAALLPIGGTFTMDPDDALRAVELIAPRLAVPMHFNTMPPIRQDGAAFCRRVEAQGVAHGALLAPGESREI